jgi:hypothetical protein
VSAVNRYQTVEKIPSASLRLIASLQRTPQVRLRSSMLRAPCIWNFLNGLMNGREAFSEIKAG